MEKSCPPGNRHDVSLLTPSRHHVLPSHHQLESLATRPSNPAKLLFSTGFSRCLMWYLVLTDVTTKSNGCFSIRTREIQTHVWLLEVLSAETCMDHITYIRMSKHMSMHLKEIYGGSYNIGTPNSCRKSHSHILAQRLSTAATKHIKSVTL